MNGYPGFIARLRKATLNVDIDTAKLLVEAANVIEDISSNWTPKLGVVETLADLEALPGEAVIRDGYGYVIEKSIYYGQTYWSEMRHELGTYAECIELPAQILWVPEEET
jgi:hypothetical protein